MSATRVRIIVAALVVLTASLVSAAPAFATNSTRFCTSWCNNSTTVTNSASTSIAGAGRLNLKGTVRHTNSHVDFNYHWIDVQLVNAATGRVVASGGCSYSDNYQGGISRTCTKSVSGLSRTALYYPRSRFCADVKDDGAGTKCTAWDSGPRTDA